MDPDYQYGFRLIRIGHSALVRRAYLRNKYARITTRRPFKKTVVFFFVFFLSVHLTFTKIKLMNFRSRAVMQSATAERPASRPNKPCAASRPRPNNNVLVFTGRCPAGVQARERHLRSYAFRKSVRVKKKLTKR